MEKLVVISSLCLVFLCVRCSPTEQQHRNKGPKPLSDEPHTMEDGEHNADFDHEAFLGEEEAAEFDKLPLKESMRRLRIIFTKIDTDGDNFLTNEELKKWVEHISHGYISESVQTYFPESDSNDDGKISWEEYMDSTFGEIEDEDDVYDTRSGASFKQMIEKDQRRFKVCDKDGDGVLNVEEYTVFLHPEEFAETKEIHIQEMFDQMDRNQDGDISVEEYLEDIWPKVDRDEHAAEPDWVKEEREQFYKYRDTDGDKKLSKRELGHWISPEGYDAADAEASHLIHHADSDNDDKLSIDEVMENHDLFVGSQATDFGDYLNRHDEF